MADPATVAALAAGLFSLFTFGHPRHNDIVLNVRASFAAHSTHEEIQLSDGNAGFHKDCVLRYVNLAIGFAGPLTPDDIPLVNLMGGDSRYDTYLPLHPQGLVAANSDPFRSGIREMLVYSGTLRIKVRKGSKLAIEFTINSIAEESAMDYEITLIGAR